MEMGSGQIPSNRFETVPSSPPPFVEAGASVLEVLVVTGLVAVVTGLVLLLPERFTSPATSVLPPGPGVIRSPRMGRGRRMEPTALTSEPTGPLPDVDPAGAVPGLVVPGAVGLVAPGLGGSLLEGDDAVDERPVVDAPGAGDVEPVKIAEPAGGCTLSTNRSAPGGPPVRAAFPRAAPELALGAVACEWWLEAPREAVLGGRAPLRGIVGPLVGGAANLVVGCDAVAGAKTFAATAASTTAAAATHAHRHGVPPWPCSTVCSSRIAANGAKSSTAGWRLRWERRRR